MNATLHREDGRLIVQHDADPRFSYEVTDRQEAERLVNDTQESFRRIFGETIEITL
jgi:hypothetical protein